MGARLVVVRHGETEWSRTGRHTSTTDLPLTEVGEEQAVALAPVLAGLGIDAVLSSPRLRARRTAELIGFPDPVVTPDLAEWSYGDYEGVTTPEIRETVPDWTIWSHGAPGGESAEEVAARLDRVVEQVRATGGTTLAVAHGHSLRALVARWLGLPVAEGRHFVLDTATWSELGDDRGTPAVLTWNVGRRR
ncbi:histidine phosphatase family protein [Aeromicrobium sp. Leaf350]|uniref:histidine phosphatase family protein n=1 Tax=Aeromicrobium sp. Leaf350 TaxID=2876565 RepID=UPI001E4039C5|nr:histidine phosphatase family protein [Aeromicrobium sp. Leaf350]